MFIVLNFLILLQIFESKYLRNLTEHLKGTETVKRNVSIKAFLCSGFPLLG